ncbi:TrbI/VirB10 family protein [Escherichia marmotae]|jgi:type IV secretion system protein VirB10|uniref:TrbI/VirB10 family protein n=1 Tax=Escherichia TaxID=561 RepID=UPI00098581FA|nr:MULTISPECIES: TrbI/VirB10 family protein [Escherichia]EJK0936083.1 TrbI/VirB10 family protein [Escherichia coli]MDQ9253401.1 TrbI/VirB10 family protein [Escherichia marmotae]OOI63478.1 conjugal transfer protein TrbI [Escherichia coli]OOJ62901.1 conjugal transfer protein TrbI [Escherichia coli]HAG7092357.1 conjugal transfer protein TrbI [Escherichia coli]
MKNNSDIVFEKLDEIDSREVDTDAQNRNFIHSGKKQGNKKAKAIFILAVFAFVTVVILTAVLSKVFSSSEEEKATETASTKAQAEVYTRNTQAKNLDDLKEAVASSIEEVKNNVNSEEEQAREETRPENKGVTLPTENETDAGYAQSNGDAPPTPAQRRLMGSVMVDDNRISQSQPGSSGQKTAGATSATSDNTNVSDDGDFLQGADFADGTVSRIKNRRFLLSAGTTFSCVLKTKIVTTYPGVTLCQLTKDVISDDGKNVLIRAGAQLQGEQTRAITQGMARVFVNWTIVKDKNNRVRIDSLGTDSLGASGLPAWVDTHFWKRFGGALMLSLIEDSIAAGTSRMSRTNNSEFTMNNTTGTSSELAKTTLDNSINIPPTGYVNQGEMLTVIVPRNIDFSSLYGVR